MLAARYVIPTWHVMLAARYVILTWHVMLTARYVILTWHVMLTARYVPSRSLQELEQRLLSPHDAAGLKQITNSTTVLCVDQATCTVELYCIQLIENC